MKCTKLFVVATAFTIAACGGKSSSESASTTTETAKETAAPEAVEPEVAEPETAEPAEDTAPTETAKVGEPAPAFTLTDLEGNEVSLADFKGKIVVLEWFNPGCPFIQYAHKKGPLATMPKKTGDDVVWLAINSNAPGKQGNGAETNRKAKKEFGFDYPVLLDASGKVGLAYGAKATPHMYVIDKEGTLVYMGALDNKPTGKLRGDTHISYVAEALAALAADEPVKTAETQAYGCSVKYAVN